ncbi:lysophospholipid acyltransferase family protein [Sorangium sp. So ce134]
MGRAGGVPLAIWLGYWRAMRRYHRYEVEGFEHVARPGAALIVGYHGRPIAHDMCILTAEIHDRLGYMPHAIVHGAAERQPLLKWVVDGLGFVTGDSAALEEAIARGEHVLVTPGGTREGCRSSRDRYRVDWGERFGYLRLALKYRLPIIPVGAAGVDDTYIGFNDGYRLGKRLGVPHGLPLWLGVGVAGLWPLSPPLPVKFRQCIGAPIDLLAEGPVDERDRGRLAVLHRRVTGAVQGLLDRARGRATPGAASGT